MEESSNGKLGEIQKMETQDGYREVSGEFKTEVEAGSARLTLVTLNPEPVTETHNRDDSYEADSNECRTDQKVDSGEMEEKIVKDSNVDSVEPEVHSPFEKLIEGVEVPVEQEEALDDVAVLESTVIEDNISLSSVETNRDSKVIEEVIVPCSDANGCSSQGETKVVSNTIEEIPIASSDEGMVQIECPSPDDDCEVPPATVDVVSKAIDNTNLPALEKNPEESSATADLESKEKVDEPLKEAANAGSADNEPEIPASTENQPVTPLSQRSIQPTSWRSCCGLLQILHRSDR
ncbi:hypothetical protein AB3S75_037708 [Citrus x aurantiifolia]